LWHACPPRDRGAIGSSTMHKTPTVPASASTAGGGTRLRSPGGAMRQRRRAWRPPSRTRDYTARGDAAYRRPAEHRRGRLRRASQLGKPQSPHRMRALRCGDRSDRGGARPHGTASTVARGDATRRSRLRNRSPASRAEDHHRVCLGLPCPLPRVVGHLCMRLPS